MPSARIARDKLTEDVALRAHVGGRPVAELGAVEREAVVVFGHRHHVLGAGLREQLGPALGVEALALEARDQVLVAKAILAAEGVEVVLVALAALLVHLPRVPLVAEGRQREHAPVHEDAELRVAKPGRRLVGAERSPIRPEGPSLGPAGGRLDTLQHARALTVELGHRLLPDRVDLLRRQRIRRRCVGVGGLGGSSGLCPRGIATGQRHPRGERHDGHE